MPSPAPITSRSNARVKALRAAFSGDARNPGDLIGIEGEHLLQETLRSNLTPENIFLRQGSEYLLERLALPVYAVTLLAPDVFDSAVDTATPQGIAATLAIPAVALPASPNLVLILEAIQDPGNLGTLLRSAEAFGASLVLFTPDSANPWSPKVIRSSAGSVFRTPTLRTSLSDIRRRTLGLHLYAAVAASPHSVAPHEARLTMPSAIMIGNEGTGLSAAALALADTHITIPCAVESLNAAIAGSILLYEAQRQRNP